MQGEYSVFGRNEVLVVDQSGDLRGRAGANACAGRLPIGMARRETSN